MANYQRALELKPDFAVAHSNLLFIHNYRDDCSTDQRLSEAKRFGEMVARQVRVSAAWQVQPEVGRSLRVGLVSGDFRQHPVGNFLEGVLEALVRHASDRLTFFAYSTQHAADSVTERVKTSCCGWQCVVGLSDAQLAERIRADRIDILIDLSGHTSGNRLPMFAWKPAPVQATWLGYLATTGVGAIDYLIADAWTLPESEEVHFTEKIWRLPESYLCFTPPDAAIDVSPLPALSTGQVTFGCFNNLSKMNDAVVALWSRVLHAVPGSRLFLKASQLKEASVRQSIIDRFAAHGIDAERLILEGLVPRAEYLVPFQRVDIALDPFPYPGITTSVENLWMGIPVLTLAGESFLSRQGVGLLMNAGLPEWIATAPDDYVARAVSHAGDLDRLAELRSGLRQQVLASPIFDAQRFAGHFEAALRGMWKAWCDHEVESRGTHGERSFTSPTRPSAPASNSSGNIIASESVVRGILCSDNPLMKLHIGGKEPKEGWKILNALDFEGVDFVGNVRDLSAFPDACCEKVYASHVMEHVGQRDFVDTLKGIHRILCENGELYFSVPDLETLCRLFIRPELDRESRYHVMRMMFGGQIDDFDFHYIGLTCEFMTYFFNLAGFSSARRVESFGIFNDTSDYRPYGVPISLNMIARK
ncbi:hypothetical protein PROAA_3420001 [Candidatus Propionivibrio aalborgensis]|uniref:Methyltransferase type 11 n=1 Tax=Candidatus Propionivibrio aalborgensis TaxID=1860101 RepID=A0A1A8Y0A9_9RHOO|nr:hypothetical protein PROAA_3420001 [Candidatus Propionivibrio aalborgensis]